MEDVHYVNIREKHSDIPTKLKDIIYNTSQTLHILKNISRGGLTGSLAGIIAYNFNDISLRENIEIGCYMGMLFDQGQGVIRHLYEYSKAQTISEEDNE